MLADLPFLGAGMVHQTELHDAILENRDGIDFLEVSTDRFMSRLPEPEWLDRLVALKTHFPTVAHGIYLSLGDASGPRHDYLERLKGYLDLLEPVWFSDHLDMGNVPQDPKGQVGHGWPVPFSREQAAVFRANARAACARTGRPLLVENIFYTAIIPASAPLPEPVFIGEILGDTDCGLLLDLTNLQINAENFGFDPGAWLEQAPLERTVEIHVAGGELRTSGNWRGKWFDSHSQPVPDAVWRLVEWVVARAPVKAIVLEREANYPPLRDILDELRIARRILAGSRRQADLARMSGTLILSDKLRSGQKGGDEHGIRRGADDHRPRDHRSGLPRTAEERSGFDSLHAERHARRGRGAEGDGLGQSGAG